MLLPPKVPLPKGHLWTALTCNSAALHYQYGLQTGVQHLGKPEVASVMHGHMVPSSN